MNATVDPDLLKLVQQHVNTLKTDVEVLTFEVQEDKERVSHALKDISTSLEELEARVVSVQREQEVMKRKQSDADARVSSVEHEQEVVKQVQSSLSKRVDSLQSSVDTRVANVEHEQEVMKEEQSSLSDKMKDVQQRVAGVEDKLSSPTLQENRGKCACIWGDESMQLI